MKIWAVLTCFSLIGANVCQPLHAEVRPYSWPGCHQDSVCQPDPRPLDLHPPQEVSVSSVNQFIEAWQQHSQRLTSLTTDKSVLSSTHDGWHCVRSADVQCQRHHSAAGCRQIHTLWRRESLSDLTEDVFDVCGYWLSSQAAGSSMQGRRPQCKWDGSTVKRLAAGSSCRITYLKTRRAALVASEVTQNRWEKLWLGCFLQKCNNEAWLSL